MNRIFIITFFLSIRAFAQDSIINYIKNNPIKYFDIKSFEKDNEIREDVKLFYNERGDHFEQFMSSVDKGHFIENETKKNSPISIARNYYSNGVLYYETIFFFDFKIDTTKKYNKLGLLKETINNDKNYAFSISSLCQLMKKEYNVDLMTIQNNFSKDYNPDVNYDVMRMLVEEIGKYCYIVILYSNPLPPDSDFYPRRLIYIDGNTGEILCEEEIFLWLLGGENIPKSKSSFPSKEEYLKRIKNKNKLKTTTFNGKTYTEEEWKAFEQEQWKKYQAKRNQKGPFDWLFG